MLQTAVAEIAAWNLVRGEGFDPTEVESVIDHDVSRSRRRKATAAETGKGVRHPVIRHLGEQSLHTPAGIASVKRVSDGSIDQGNTHQSGQGQRVERRDQAVGVDHVRPMPPDEPIEPVEQADVPPHAPSGERDGNRRAGQLVEIEVIGGQTYDMGLELGMAGEALDELDGLPLLTAHAQRVYAQQHAQPAGRRSSGAALAMRARRSACGRQGSHRAPLTIHRRRGTQVSRPWIEHQKTRCSDEAVVGMLIMSRRAAVWSDEGATGSSRHVPPCLNVIIRGRGRGGKTRVRSV